MVAGVAGVAVDPDVVPALSADVDDVAPVAAADVDVPPRTVSDPVVAVAECAVVSEAASTPSPTAAAVAATPISAVMRRTLTRAASLFRWAGWPMWSDSQ